VHGEDRASRDEILFVQLVSMFQIAAMQQMGKIPNPLSHEIERDLDQASVTIDILGMIKDKTKGNLSKEEEEFLDKVLFEARMNYLEELKRPEGKTGDGGGAGTEKGRGDEPDGEMSQGMEKG
jgi:hypothetical protein